MALHIRFHDAALSICQLPLNSQLPIEIFREQFSYFFRTHNEVTLICPTAVVPQNSKAEHGFVPFEVVGPFEFNVTGVLTQVANPLTAAGVSIVALSTFNTDYVLIKFDHRDKAIEALRRAGHTVHENRLG
jgi:hypothetical protein